MIVIPYFLRQAGLLHRALTSICDQEYRSIQVVVIDDDSTRSAADEITATLRDALPRLTVIRQSNQRVAAARNTALDALREKVLAIAFLDSDDYWDPAHIRNAAVSLSRGVDFYFAHQRIEGATTDWFGDRADLLDESRLVPEALGIMQRAGSVATLIVSKCPVQTSSVVFRHALIPQVRFPRALRGCEDQWVWWALLARSSANMYCPEPTVTYGAGGVGGYQHTSFGLVRFLVRRADWIRYRHHLLNKYPLTPGERRLQEKLGGHREAALFSTLHSLRRRIAQQFSWDSHRINSHCKAPRMRRRTGAEVHL